MSLESSVDKALQYASKELAYGANGTQLTIDAFLENTSLPDETILDLIAAGELSQITNVLNGWENRIVSLIKESYDVSFSNGMLDFTLRDVAPTSINKDMDVNGIPTEGNKRYTWVRHPITKSCPDCISRDGQVKTLAEWEEFGFPGDGLTLCGGNCHCTLDPV